ncbi:hypothetical protein KCP76_19640 [Salmonella enterica subsp. enterica serovar Weltevreden]|nr:hypothetical protein KCP76_19640 [Salmonella enterica subsp. enterica serovar Weltevreden]
MQKADREKCVISARHINAVSGLFTGEINATSGKFSGVIKRFVGDICVKSHAGREHQGDERRTRSTSTRYTDSATYPDWEGNHHIWWWLPAVRALNGWLGIRILRPR